MLRLSLLHKMLSLHCLFDVSSHVHSLQSLGIESRFYGNLLCLVLLTKLPTELQLSISQKVSKSDRSLDSLMEVIEEDIAAKERIGTNTNS